jgi:hypothetical protein
VTLTGGPFDDHNCHVDWLLSVPLLLTKPMLVMKLPKAEAVSRGWKSWRSTIMGRANFCSSRAWALPAP